jgi:hypothetical protein
MEFFIPLILYFLPSFIAFFRNRSNGNAIILANIFFGWTIIGWVIVLIWALSDDKQTIILRRKE